MLHGQGPDRDPEAPSMLIRRQPQGLYCEVGDFFIDPSKGVDRAVITHAHADHARRGSRHYLCASPCEALLKIRLGKTKTIESIPYGEKRNIHGVEVSFHPAGHILGSSQVRLEYKGEIWVVSGDYKLQKDPTCTPFEPVQSHHFISECTFGAPIYQWPDPQGQWDRLKRWWHRNQQAGLNSLIRGYSLGKAQRILHACEESSGPILLHPSVEEFLPSYQAEGVSFPPFQTLSETSLKAHDGKMLVIAPPSAHLSFISKRPSSWEMIGASGWLMVTHPHRKKHQPTGLVISDHADWPGLLEAIKASQAHTIHLVHGNGNWLAQLLLKEGKQVVCHQTSSQKVA